MLRATTGPLADESDLVMFDLDGVVYVGDDPVAHASEAISRLRHAGQAVAFITNNASRPPDAVVAKLAKTGVASRVDEVVTSAQAAARVLSERFGAGARIGVLGGEGLAEALATQELVVASVWDEELDAVVSGYGPDVLWQDIMRAAVRIRDGLPWVASNTDASIPTPYGIAPGHGVLVDLLRRFTSVEPTVAGKPARPLFDETLDRTGASRPLMVGDRLDTDISGAVALDIASLLVMTGVTHLRELIAAEPALRPDYIAADLRGLLEPQPVPEVEGESFILGGWRAEVRDGRLQIDSTSDRTGAGAARGESTTSDWWRVAAAAGWAYLDETGSPAEVDGTLPA